MLLSAGFLPFASMTRPPRTGFDVSPTCEERASRGSLAHAAVAREPAAATSRPVAQRLGPAPRAFPPFPVNLPLLKSPAARREALGLLLLILVVLASRLPFIMRGLDEWDSSNFALSVVRFDVLSHQPHPPGQYFYVRLMQLINLFSGDELFTLSLAGAVCSSLALAPYYLALRQIFRPAVALSAVALTAFTFGYWTTSLRVISDPVACLFVYGVVCSLLIGLTDRRWFWFGMALCGVALGVKQTAVYFLAPFVIAINLAVLVRCGWRRPLLGSALFAVAVAAWLLPTVGNAHGWASYLDACRASQQENYHAESIIFHLSRLGAKIQARQNLIQPWGAAALAGVMLALAAAGLVVCCRRGLRGALFGLFSATVALYCFFFLYRFNKYFVYSLPCYCAFAAAALFALGDWLARRTRLPFLGRWLPGVGVALVTAVNFGLTAPLLPGISRFRAPPQAALEDLLAMPGVEPKPLLFTDDAATSRELLYFHLKNKLDLLNRHPDGLRAAAAALDAGRKIYFLSPLLFGAAVAHSDAIRLLGQYVWRPELYEPLQGRHDLRPTVFFTRSPLRFRSSTRSPTPQRVRPCCSKACGKTAGAARTRGSSCLPTRRGPTSCTCGSRSARISATASRTGWSASLPTAPARTSLSSSRAARISWCPCRIIPACATSSWSCSPPRPPGPRSATPAPRTAASCRRCSTRSIASRSPGRCRFTARRAGTIWKPTAPTVFAGRTATLPCPSSRAKPAS